MGHWNLSQIPQMAYILDTLNKGGVYHEDFSLMHGTMMLSRLEWGIQDNLLMDKKIEDRLNPLTKEIALELQKDMKIWTIRLR